MLESRIVKGIMKSLGINFPGFYFKVHGGPFQVAGIPDIVGLHKGRFIAIEVKCPGKEDTLSEKQQNTINKIKAAGGIAFMTTSKEDTLIILQEEFKNVSRKSGRAQKGIKYIK